MFIAYYYRENYDVSVPIDDSCQENDTGINTSTSSTTETTLTG